MKIKLFIISLLCLFLSVSLQAQIEVSLKETKQSGQKALVTLEMKNTYSQDLKAARVWVFLTDEAGKVVGQKAQWIVGSDSTTKQAVSKKSQPLKPGTASEYSVAVDTLRGQSNEEKPFKAKITYSRLILADGSVLNPQKAVVAPKE